VDLSRFSREVMSYEMREYKVDIVVPTYNQEKYITQAIQSILNQDCDINYRIIIGEDCSQDNTRHICERFAEHYPEKILLIKNDVNLGLVKNYQKMFNHCNAKYTAILEGDDYWIDQLKLRKQIDILEADESIGLVHTGSYTLTEKGEMKYNHLSIPRSMLEGNLFESLLVRRNTISPMTVMFRKFLLDKYIDFDFYITNNFKTVDYPMWLAISKHTKIGYISEPTAVYRFLQKSESRPGGLENIEAFYQTALISKKYYYSKFPVKGLSEKEVFSELYITLTETAISHKNFEKAREFANHIVPMNFKSRLLRKASKNKSFYYIFRIYLQFLPCLSYIKQRYYRSIS
jgi:glycosyltransferase involved in cell wall biosynthesis